jgi:hypothetical protein
MPLFYAVFEGRRLHPGCGIQRFSSGISRSTPDLRCDTNLAPARRRRIFQFGRRIGFVWYCSAPVEYDRGNPRSLRFHESRGFVGRRRVGEDLLGGKAGLARLQTARRSFSFKPSGARWVRSVSAVQALPIGRSPQRDLWFSILRKTTSWNERVSWFEGEFSG